jgi:penicillin amidase
VRDGFTNNTRWIPDATRDEDQASEFEILPFDEMDGLVNPARGYIVNANQDPTGQTFDNNPLNELRPGGGIRYISPGHSDGNRATRITERIEQALASGGTVSFSEMKSIQADTKLNDAAVLVPYIRAAFQHAQAGGASPGLAALGDNPGVVEAVNRLRRWNYTTPTGIPEGYDPKDTNGGRVAPTSAEMRSSVATTIYSLWRSRAVALFVDAPLQARGLGAFLPPSEQAMSALRHMLEGSGTGASGIVFFANADARDKMILQAMRDALDRAASPDFAPAFNESTDQDDYRWGYLHRITFRHPLGPAYSFPTGAGFADLQPDLPGVATDGGFAVVDASSHSPRANSVNGFTFGSGPARRFVAEGVANNPKAVEIIPGGSSGGPWGPWFGNQLGRWLTNDYHPATVAENTIRNTAVDTLELTP